MSAVAARDAGADASGADATLSHVAAVLLFAGATTLFLVSPMLLTHWGVNYELPGGNVAEKVHPGTWMIALALAVTALRFGNPLRFGASALSLFPGLLAFAPAWAFVVYDAIVIQKLPFTPMIDSFLLPMMAMLALAAATTRQKRRIALALHAALIANAALGLAEYLMGFRLTPYVAGEFVLEQDWRSTALLGHPLANASVMGVYIITLGLGGGRDLPVAVRALALGLSIASMIAFGGRASLVLSLTFLSLTFAARATAVARGARVSQLTLGVGLALAPILVVGIGELYAAGFFDQMLERFVNDHGSAKARLIMLAMFKSLSWREIILGPDPTKIQALQNLEGVEYGLESFFVAYVLTYGAIVSGLFFIGVAFLCREIVRAAGARAIPPLLFFFIVAATSVSLSAKTCAFGMLVALVQTMLRPDAPRARV